MASERVGIVASCFDLFHAGHVLMLMEAKENCDRLVVALQSDPTIDRPEKNKPVQSIVERYIQLKAVKFVDEIIVYNTEKDLEDLLSTLAINIRIVGEEYKDIDFTGKNICIKRNIKLIYNKREHNFSTTNLRKSIYLNELNKELEKNNKPDGN